jgi:hypothetical protein
VHKVPHTGASCGEDEARLDLLYFLFFKRKCLEKSVFSWKFSVVLRLVHSQVVFAFTVPPEVTDDGPLRRRFYFRFCRCQWLRGHVACVRRSLVGKLV